MKQEHQQLVDEILASLPKNEVVVSEENLSKAEAVIALVESPDYLAAVIRNDSLGRNDLELPLLKGRIEDTPASILIETIVLRVGTYNTETGITLSGDLEGRVRVEQVFSQTEELLFGKKLPKALDEVKQWFETQYSVFGWAIDDIEHKPHSYNWVAYMNRDMDNPADLAKTHGSQLDIILNNLKKAVTPREEGQSKPR